MAPPKKLPSQTKPSSEQDPLQGNTNPQIWNDFKVMQELWEYDAHLIQQAAQKKVTSMNSPSSPSAVATAAALAAVNSPPLSSGFMATLGRLADAGTVVLPSPAPAPQVGLSPPPPLPRQLQTTTSRPVLTAAAAQQPLQPSRETMADLNFVAGLFENDKVLMERAKRQVSSNVAVGAEAKKTKLDTNAALPASIVGLPSNLPDLNTPLARKPRSMADMVAKQRGYDDAEDYEKSKAQGKKTDPNERGSSPAL